MPSLCPCTVQSKKQPKRYQERDKADAAAASAAAEQDQPLDDPVLEKLRQQRCVCCMARIGPQFFQRSPCTCLLENTVCKHCLACALVCRCLLSGAPFRGLTEALCHCECKIFFSTIIRVRGVSICFFRSGLGSEAPMDCMRRLVEEADFRAAQELFSSDDKALDTLIPKCATACGICSSHTLLAMLANTSSPACDYIGSLQASSICGRVGYTSRPKQCQPVCLSGVPLHRC